MITRSPHVGGEVDLVQADGGTISQQQRRERIRREVLAHGRVRIESLVEQYGAGGMPIRAVPLTDFDAVVVDSDVPEPLAE